MLWARRLAALLATREQFARPQDAKSATCSAFRDGPAWIRTRDQRIMSPLL
jgi:hypothetical protein